MDSNKDTLYARWLSGELTKEEQQQLEGSTELADLEAIISTADQLTLPKYDAEAAVSYTHLTLPTIYSV